MIVNLMLSQIKKVKSLKKITKEIDTEVSLCPKHLICIFKL